MTLALVLLLGLSGALAAPTEPPANPFLEGLDGFLAAFDGLALSGDPVAAEVSSVADPVSGDPVSGDPVSGDPVAAEVPSAADPQGAPTPPPEQQQADIVTKVAPCLGCVQEIEAVSAEFRRVAQLAAELLEDELNMTQVTEVTEVYRAARQVVNGIKYFLTLELMPTNCSRPSEEADVCLVDPEAGALLYSVEILERPQQELGAELLLFNEVLPEEVADLPGLFSGPEPPPPSPSPPPAAEEQPGLAGLDADLTAMIGDMKRLWSDMNLERYEEPAEVALARQGGVLHLV